MPPPRQSMSQGCITLTGKYFLHISNGNFPCCNGCPLSVGLCALEKCPAPLLHSTPRALVHLPAVSPLLSAPSLPSFRVSSLPLGLSQVFGGLGYPSAPQKRRQWASGSLQLERCLCFVLGKKSGEPGRLFPIASPWQQAFQTHARRQTGQGGREHDGPSA